MKKKNLISRRSTLKGIGAIGALTVLDSKTAHSKEEALTNPDLNYCSSAIRKEIFQKVFQTPFIDTHEHLVEEKERFIGTAGSVVKSDDWTVVLSQYLDSDMETAGMPGKDVGKFFSPGMNPVDKWALLEPYWPAVKNTGYGQAVCITLKQLYDVGQKTAEKTWQLPLWDEYFKLDEGAARRKYWRDNPILSQYVGWRNDFMYRNPDLVPYIEDDPDKFPTYPSLEELQQMQAAQPNFTQEEWQSLLGLELFRLVLDGDELPPVAERRLDQLGIDSDFVQQSLQNQ